MNIQRISNFYIPNVSVAINIKKRTLEIYKNDSDQEVNENDQVDLPLEVGITDFWALNSLYKRLVTTADIKNMNNCELLTAIEVNFKSFNDFAINNEIKNNKNSYNDSDSYSEKVIENDIEVQVIFMWRFQHYWLNSISAKMNLSKIRVNQILRKYKLLIKKLRLKKLEKRRKVNLVINDKQIDQIKQYIERTSSTPIKISMIKQAVWPQTSGAKAPCNSTISKYWERNWVCLIRYSINGIRKEKILKLNVYLLNLFIYKPN